MESFQLLSDTSEKELILAAQQGSISAFKKLYQTYKDKVYNFIFYFLGQATLAEDVLQTVFIKAYQALPNFRFEAKFLSWLYRIAINECHDQQKRLANYLPLETILGTGEELDINQSPDKLHAQEQRQEIIQTSLSQLSPNLREVIILKYLEDMSYEEIALVLDCSIGTVASRLHRALAQLEKNLLPLKRFLLER
ncbi:MAG: RNA polymerase sigma factor [Acidobacteria bacterium]|nr:RNA polymerase sigma factor [Acidobacteriota bacterium]